MVVAVRMRTGKPRRSGDTLNNPIRVLETPRASSAHSALDRYGTETAPLRSALGKERQVAFSPPTPDPFGDGPLRALDSPPLLEPEGEFVVA